MDAKEFLKQPEKLDMMIKNKLIEKQQWYEIALGITSSMEHDRVHSSGGKSKMADAIDKCVDMEAEINSLIDKLVDSKRSVIQAIEALGSTTEYNVLHMRYIQRKSLRQIADFYGKDYTWATTVHGRAVEHIRQVLDGK